MLFDHLEPEELSEHLTYLEFKSFRRISVCTRVAGEKLPWGISEHKQRNSTACSPPNRRGPSVLVGLPHRLCAVGGSGHSEFRCCCPAPPSSMPAPPLAQVTIPWAHTHTHTHTPTYLVPLIVIRLPEILFFSNKMEICPLRVCVHSRMGFGRLWGIPK